jgi:hypothetical protein
VSQGDKCSTRSEDPGDQEVGDSELGFCHLLPTIGSNTEMVGRAKEQQHLSQGEAERSEGQHPVWTNQMAKTHPLHLEGGTC